MKPFVLDVRKHTHRPSAAASVSTVRLETHTSWPSLSHCLFNSSLPPYPTPPYPNCPSRHRLPPLPLPNTSAPFIFTVTQYVANRLETLAFCSVQTSQLWGLTWKLDICSTFQCPDSTGPVHINRANICVAGGRTVGVQHRIREIREDKKTQRRREEKKKGGKGRWKVTWLSPKTCHPMIPINKLKM